MWLENELHVVMDEPHLGQCIRVGEASVGFVNHVAAQRRGEGRLPACWQASLSTAGLGAEYRKATIAGQLRVRRRHAAVVEAQKGQGFLDWGLPPTAHARTATQV